MNTGQDTSIRRGTVRLAGGEPRRAGPALIAAIRLGNTFITLPPAPGFAADRAADPGEGHAGRNAFRGRVGIADGAIPGRDKPQVRTILVAGAGITFFV